MSNWNGRSDRNGSPVPITPKEIRQMNKRPKAVLESMIHPAGHNRWDVDSRSNPGASYRVNWVGTGYVCTCAYYQAHQGTRECPHGRAVSDLMASKNEQARLLEMVDGVELPTIGEFHIHRESERLTELQREIEERERKARKFVSMWDDVA